MKYWLPTAERRTYRGLKKAWIGFRISEQEGNHEKMMYYVEGIQKFEMKLGRPISSFSDILKIVQQSKGKLAKKNGDQRQ